MHDLEQQKAGRYEIQFEPIFGNIWARFWTLSKCGTVVTPFPLFTT
jgi:hypothetical protein